MSTPRTNERTIEFRGRSGEWVSSGFARGLERENTKLRKDKERLDWLLSEDSNAHVEVGRYGHGDEYKPWIVDTLHNRYDIDEAMKEEAQHEDR